MPRTPLFLGLLAVLAQMAQAEHEEVLVTAPYDTHIIDVTETLEISPDAAQLLKQAPGANVNSNGPLTGIVQYRGMYGPRVATTIDGAALASAGPNAMDPPISYSSPGQLQSLALHRGIAPVSVAQESIGGAVEVTTRQPDFTADSEFAVTGHIQGSSQSVSGGKAFSGAVFAGNNQHRVKLAALTEAGDDAEFEGGEILPSEYERQRYDLGYGFRSGNHLVQFDYTYSDTGDTGTAALPMDIEYIEGDLYNLAYQFDINADLKVEARVFASDLDHGMTNYHLRKAPPPANWRRNITTSDNLGFKLQTTWADRDGRWVFGFDGFSASHNSDIDNPQNPMFFVVNFNDAERQILGAFLERQQDLGDNWRGEFGLRYNRVDMDADEVNGTPAMMMPPAMALRDAFNSADRSQRDTNIDAVAKLWYDFSHSTTFYGGLAQKQRAPSYQERYLWLPLQATGGLADGFNYTGNIELDSETSRQVELGMDYHHGALTLAPRVFYHRVDDYIQGTPSTVMPAVMMVRMMNNMNGTNNPDPLQFNNVDAEFYGFDMDWRLALDDRWSLSGLVNYVRGERRDIDDNLYRIAPPNTSLRLEYQGQRWQFAAETVAYASQDDVSVTNAEQETAGYAVVNLSAIWQITDKLQLAAGVYNVFDRCYRDHLAGYNRAANPDIARGERLPGYGVNAFAQVSYEF